MMEGGMIAMVLAAHIAVVSAFALLLLQQLR
jgi:hypothetical protein